MCGWNDEKRIEYCFVYVQENHRRWVKDISKTPNMQWNEFEEAFVKEARDRLGFDETSLFAKLSNLKMLDTEKVVDYAARLERLAQPLGDMISDFNKKQIFMHGLKEIYKLDTYKGQNHRTGYDYAVQKAKKVEAEYRYICTVENRPSELSVGIASSLDVPSSSSDSTVKVPPVNDSVITGLFTKPSSSASSPSKTLPPTPAISPDVVDKLSEQIKALTLQVSKLEQPKRQGGGNPNKKYFPNTPMPFKGQIGKCFHCGDSSHIVSTCPRLVNKDQTTVHPTTPVPPVQPANSVTATLVQVIEEVEENLVKEVDSEGEWQVLGVDNNGFEVEVMATGDKRSAAELDESDVTEGSKYCK